MMRRALDWLKADVKTSVLVVVVQQLVLIAVLVCALVLR